MTGFTDSLDFC